MKALILIQGINQKGNYLLQGTESILAKYDKVFYLKTERIFDDVKESLPLYLKWIPDKYKELLADLLGFFKNKYVRKALNYALIDKIEEFQKEGYEVDILSHSLGTLIALGGGTKDHKIKVNRLFLLNCPLGIDFKTLRLYVKFRMCSISKHFTCDLVYNVWSNNDFVSKDMHRSLKFIEDRAERSVHVIVKGGGHSHIKSVKKIENVS